MKLFNMLLAFVLMSASTLFAQITDEEKNEVYPENYTLEKAEEFRQKGEYEKAIWFYINIFPTNKTEVIEIVKGIESELDTVDMSAFIKKTFAVYGTLDPAITSFENGTLLMDMDKLKLKGAWGDELIQKIANPNAELSSGSEYNFRGLDKVNAGDYVGALADFDKAIELKATGQIYYNRAYTRSLVKDFTGAVEDYDKTIEFAYRLSEAYFERGYCYDNLNQPEAAIADYTKAIEYDENHAEAYNNRGVTNLKQKNYKGAISDFDQAIKINPKFLGAYINRGFAKLGAGKTSAACKDWEKAIELGYPQAQAFIDENCN